MSAAHSVRFFFDFVSPYSWLALMNAQEFSSRHAVSWDLRPVVYAKLLDATGLVGPVEVEVKRRYTMHDVVRCAGRAGLRVQGPPAHPFRSLEALRAICLFHDQPRILELAIRLADACWGEGRDLTDLSVLTGEADRLGFDVGGLAAGLGTDAVKGRLRDSTASALAAGAFGVPTFEWHGELFWGHDRLDHLADRLTGRLGVPGPIADGLIGRASGAMRPRSARTGDS